MAGLALRHRNGNVASGCWQRPCSKNATRFSYEDWYGAGRVQRGFRDIQAFLDSWRRWSTSDPKWQSLDQSLPECGPATVGLIDEMYGVGTIIISATTVFDVVPVAVIPAIQSVPASV